ncbi:MAG: orotate phosphoribosyltransferase [Gammaproteobacteria bacterium]
MHEYQRDFIDFALRHEVLQFGQFELKSGRISPYFFNTGLFNSGTALSRLGEFYARAIIESGIEFDQIFGPAYKGISLGATIAISFGNSFGRDIPFTFNRKELKDHGEGGNTFGAPLAGRVLIVDDVISAGTSVGESVKIISDGNAEASGVMISLDRQERGRDNLSAVDDVRHRYEIPVHSIVTLVNIVEYLENESRFSAEINAIRHYRSRYGA